MNTDLQVIYPKKIDNIKHLWINKSKIALILSILASVILFITTIVFAIIIIAAFTYYLKSANIFISMVSSITLFSVITSIIIIANIGFSYGNYKTQELNKNLILIIINQIILFIMIIFSLIIIIFTFILVVNVMSNYAETMINLRILGWKTYNEAISIAYVGMALIIIITITLCLYLAYMVYYLSKYSFYKRIIWNNYNSKYQ